jgi:ABC-type dipeptide/oligopeptide/nickel transport system permease component
MVGYARSRAVLWCASLFGAVVFACAVAALAEPAARVGLAPYLGTVLKEIPDMIRFAPGPSAISNGPALAAATPALEVSLRLLVGATPIALILGSLFALRLAPPRRPKGAAALMQAARSVPLFCLALFLAALLGAASPGDADLDLVMPLIVLIGLAGAGAVALSVTQAFATIGGVDGGGLARFGLRKGAIMRRYMARYALAAVLRNAGSIMLALFTATAVVEWVFGWPGAGAAFIRSVALADWNVVAVFILVIAVTRFTLDLAGELFAFALLGEGSPA